MIEDVISGVRESFIDEGVDEQVLLELKQIWEAKLMSSKAIELNTDPPEPQVPQINTHKAVPVNKGNTCLVFLKEAIDIILTFHARRATLITHFI